MSLPIMVAIWGVAAGLPRPNSYLTTLLTGAALGNLSNPAYAYDSDNSTYGTYGYAPGGTASSRLEYYTASGSGNYTKVTVKYQLDASEDGGGATAGASMVLSLNGGSTYPTTLDTVDSSVGSSGLITNTFTFASTAITSIRIGFTVQKVRIGSPVFSNASSSATIYDIYYSN